MHGWRAMLWHTHSPPDKPRQKHSRLFWLFLLQYEFSFALNNNCELLVGRYTYSMVQMLMISSSTVTLTGICSWLHQPAKDVTGSLIYPPLFSVVTFPKSSREWITWQNNPSLHLSIYVYKQLYTCIPTIACDSQSPEERLKYLVEQSTKL